jgi:Flp pilus assembly protein TadD
MRALLLTLPVLGLMAVTPALAVDAADAEAQVYQAVQNRQWDVAEKLLREGLQQSPTDAKQLLNLAYVLQSNGRKSEAADLYARVLTLESNSLVTLDSDTRLSAKILAKRRMAALSSAP